MERGEVLEVLKNRIGTCICTLGIEKHEFLLSMISKVKTIIENIPAFDYRFLSILPQKL